MRLMIVALLTASALACTPRVVEVPVPVEPAKSDYQLCAERVGKQYTSDMAKDTMIAKFCGYPAGGKP